VNPEVLLRGGARLCENAHRRRRRRDAAEEACSEETFAMSNHSDRKTGARVLGLGFAVSLTAGTVAAADNPFEFVQLQQGYGVAAEGACGAHDEQAGEGKCGAADDGDEKSAEGKCGA
jgi:uncharacterized low-complexity protein